MSTNDTNWAAEMAKLGKTEAELDAAVAETRTWWKPEMGDFWMWAYSTARGDK